MISSGTALSRGEVVLAGAVERGVGELFEQHVRLAVEHAVALLDRGEADAPGRGGSCRCRAARGRARPRALDEAGRGELEDEARGSSSG